MLVVCFLVGFCRCFCFIFWRFAPGSVWKNSLDVRSVVFWVRSLFLWFFLSSSSFSVLFLFFSRDADQVVTGHPRTRTCFAGSFLFCVPPLLSVSPVLAVRPASWWFFGVPFWAPRVFGILLELMGLSLLTRPFRGPFLGTRGSKGFLVLLLPCFLFPLVFCGHTFSRKPGVISLTRG